MRLIQYFMMLLMKNLVKAWKPLQTSTVRFAHLVNWVGNADDSLALELEAMTREILSNKHAEQPEVFTNAINFINSMESSPSCYRLATANLLRSCRSIHPLDDSSGKPPSTVERLNRVKSMFAARLAVCELTDANAVIPQQCNSVQDRNHHREGSILKRLTTRAKYHKTYDDLNDDDDYGNSNLEVSNCLGALESRPQWWTSYSNARQNAVVMCEATRSETEKAELLDIYRKMTNVAEDVVSGLHDRSSEINLFYRERAENAKTLRNVESQAAAGFRKLTEEAQKVTTDLRGNINSLLSDFAKTISDISSTLKGNFVDVSKEVKSVQMQIHTAHSATQEFFSDMAQRNSDASIRHRNDMQSAQMMMTELKDLLSNVNNGEIKSIIMAVASLHNEIQESNGMILQMQDRQTTVNNKISELDELFEGLRWRSEVASSEQKLQVQTQREIFEAFLYDLNKAQGSIDQISSSTKDLSSTLDAATERIDNISYVSVVNQLLRYVSLMPVIFLFSPHTRRGMGIIFVLFIVALWLSSSPSLWMSLSKFCRNISQFSNFTTAISAMTITIIFAIVITLISALILHSQRVASRPFTKHLPKAELSSRDCYLPSPSKMQLLESTWMMKDRN